MDHEAAELDGVKRWQRPGGAVMWGRGEEPKTRKTET